MGDGRAFIHECKFTKSGARFEIAVERVQFISRKFEFIDMSQNIAT